MKLLARTKVKTGFDANAFINALKAKGVKTSVMTELADTGGNCIKFDSHHRGRGWVCNKAYYKGYRDHQNGRPARHKENIDYMMGYNDFEPIIVTRRVGDKRPKYTVADADYQTELTGLPEWFNSPSEALYYARAVDAPSRLGFGWRIIEYHQKNETFEQKVAEDSLIKSDVTRLYQLTITGELSTSVDGGKTWFDGGIMSYPKIPQVEIRELYGGGYRAVGKGWDYDYHYVTRTLPLIDELKKGSFKLKPPRPVPPKFDSLEWQNDEWVWWQYHQKQHDECRLDWLYGDEYRCPCYHKKVEEYKNAVKKYKSALEKWLNL